MAFHVVSGFRLAAATLGEHLILQTARQYDDTLLFGIVGQELLTGYSEHGAYFFALLFVFFLHFSHEVGCYYLCLLYVHLGGCIVDYILDCLG